MSQEKRKIVITCKAPQPAFDRIYSQLDANTYRFVTWDDEETMPREQLLEEIKDAEGLFCILKNKIDPELLNNATKLKVVSTMSVGYDHINVKECLARGIQVGNTPEVLTETTADLTITLMLATCRRIPEATHAVTSGEWSTWKPTWMCGVDLHHSTVGIVGLGRIGQAVAKRLLGFGCKILYSGRSEKHDLPQELAAVAKFVDFDTLLKESDFVVPQCPLNAETRHLFSDDAFSKMKPTAIFINTTRGEVVDQDALYKALKEKKIYAAGLDVTTPEPLPPSHQLLELKNLVVFPHIGSATIATRTQMALIAAENLIRGMKGEKLLHSVTK